MDALIRPESPDLILPLHLQTGALFHARDLFVVSSRVRPLPQELEPADTHDRSRATPAESRLTARTCVEMPR